tara:strand:- start:43 stop:645 length:603 start_codon:yes stop_codon:yes gene_type:complete
MTKDYSKGFIYKLCCKDVNIKEIYIGSSLNYKSRKKAHKSTINCITARGYNTYKYQFIRNNGGWDNWDMIEVKKYPCNDKRELEAEEDKIMRELKASLNGKNVIYNDEDQKLRDHLYYMKNRDVIIKKSKDYYDKNKNPIKKIRQQKELKDMTSSDKYYQLNKQKIKANQSIKIICECGREIRRCQKSIHIKTKIHLENI